MSIHAQSAENIAFVQAMINKYIDAVNQKMNFNEVFIGDAKYLSPYGESLEGVWAISVAHMERLHTLFGPLPAGSQIVNEGVTMIQSLGYQDQKMYIAHINWSIKTADAAAEKGAEGAAAAASAPAAAKPAGVFTIVIVEDPKWNKPRIQSFNNVLISEAPASAAAAAAAAAPAQ